MRRHVKLLTRMVATLLVMASPAASCGRPPADEMVSGTGVAPPEMSTDSGLAAFLHGGVIDIGSSRSAVVAQLGEPDSIVSRTVANRHDPAVTDSVFELYYEGLTAEIYRAGYDGKEMLTGVEITDARFMAPDASVQPGSPGALLQAEFGAATESVAGTLRYVCDECLVSGHETVDFAVSAGVVRSIRIQYWIE